MEEVVCNDGFISFLPTCWCHLPSFLPPDFNSFSVSFSPGPTSLHHKHYYYGWVGGSLFCHEVPQPVTMGTLHEEGCPSWSGDAHLDWRTHAQDKVVHKLIPQIQRALFLGLAPALSVSPRVMTPTLSTPTHPVPPRSVPNRLNFLSTEKPPFLGNCLCLKTHWALG